MSLSNLEQRRALFENGLSLFPEKLTWRQKLRALMSRLRPRRRWPVLFRWWDAYWFFTGWHTLQLGVHLDLAGPFLDIHVPFGFLRFGRLWYSDAGGNQHSRWRRAAFERARRAYVGRRLTAPKG